MRATKGWRSRLPMFAAVAVLGVVATACIPDTAPPPLHDPFQTPMLSAINADRTANGLAPLTFSPKLSVLAGGHSCDMAAAYSLFHTDLNATLNSPGYGSYSRLTENLIMAPPGYSPQQMEATWMQSDVHRDNILDPGVNVVGMNECSSADGTQWATADFGQFNG